MKNRSEGENTRERILEKARIMFNEEGATRVSTNQIAAALGMSPGNLHYHFRSRRDIVKTHFQHMADEHAPLWAGVVPGEVGVLTLVDLWYGGLEIELKYRYFYRDFHSLSREDPGLKELHRAVFEERRVRTAAFAAGCRARQLMLAPDDDAADDVNVAIWMASSMWMPFLEILQLPADTESLLLGVRMCVRTVAPHLTPGLRESLWKYFGEFSEARLRGQA